LHITKTVWNAELQPISVIVKIGLDLSCPKLLKNHKIMLTVSLLNGRKLQKRPLFYKNITSSQGLCANTGPGSGLSSWATASAVIQSIPFSL